MNPKVVATRFLRCAVISRYNAVVMGRCRMKCLYCQATFEAEPQLVQRGPVFYSQEATCPECNSVISLPAESTQERSTSIKAFVNNRYSILGKLLDGIRETIPH